ncbi:sensor histidine kinase [Hungatella sp.]|uniref:sensor histidine kinase n=1 Tax=Hungatella sp. TaxID=2613924 RepID=UPI002A80601C|nr:sensor histidine kinase [Hungatella sp.]
MKAIKNWMKLSRKNQYKNYSLQQKIMIICLLALGSMTIFSLFAMRITQEIYDKKLYERSILELEYFSNLVEDEMDAVETLTFEIAMDGEFQRQLSEVNSVTDKQVKWVAMYSLRDKMNVESIRDNTITEIIYDNKQDIKYEIRNTGEEIPKELYDQILKLTTEANGAYVYLNPTQEFPYILSGRDIRNRIDLSLKYMGTLIVAYDIKGIIDDNIKSLSGVENNVCVYSDDVMIYSNNDELFSGILGADNPLKNYTFGNGETASGYEIVNKNGKKYFRCYLKSPNSGWNFVNECTYDSIYRTLIYANRALIIAAISLFVLFAFLLRKICVVITSPLTNLAESMRIVENGDFEKAKSILLPVETHDEVGLLSEEFHIMLDKIVVLIRENYEKQITLIDTRYKALQAQINPHFLYNTLNSIGWMIKAGRNEEAQKMLTALGSQLRAAFKEEQLATVAEEMELLEHYIYIQKIRYDERVDFILEAEEEVLFIKVPRLSFQPLVENAINYGVEYSPEKCTVRVHAYRCGDRVRIEVSDNGAGMEPERLRKVRNFTMQPRQNGIGLKNINQRLELIYKDQYQLLIESQEGVGTTIIIEIPWEQVKEHV